MTKKKTKILYILPNTTQGGSETQLLYILKGIDKSKFEVTLGLLYDNGSLSKEFHSVPEIHVVNFKKKSVLDLAVFSKIAKFLTHERIDIIHSFLGNHHAYIPGLFSKNTFVVCSIRSTHTDSNILKRALRFNLLRLLQKRQRHILISNSEAGKTTYTAFGFDETSVKVIPNGIDTEKYSTSKPNKLIREFKLKGKTVISMVARLDKRKNQSEMLDTMKDLIQHHNELTLIMVGDGPERDALINKARALKIDNQVIFTGSRKDTADILAATDIFAFPTRFPEGWPNAIGEAMCAGIPCVAYPAGDIPKIIEDGKDGFVVKDKEELKEKIEKLIKDKRLRVKIGEAARKKALKEFGLKKMVKKYEAIYESVAR
jgi:glycosyltransferase involved in cell wall biosynthesis